MRNMIPARCSSAQIIRLRAFLTEFHGASARYLYRSVSISPMRDALRVRSGEFARRGRKKKGIKEKGKEREKKNERRKVVTERFQWHEENYIHRPVFTNREHDRRTPRGVHSLRTNGREITVIIAIFQSDRGLAAVAID